MSELFSLHQKTGIKATAIVGMTKNVGKTVTLNYLVREFEKAGISPGMVSAGYDGERFDRLTLKEKPRIYAPAGALVASAEACIDAADALLDTIETTALSTPLGVVKIARVKKAGLVELAGPGSVSALKELVTKMSNYGAGHILVDGAINRLASASPLLTEGTILATGAALGPTMEDVVRKTVFRRTLLETPSLEDEKLCSAAYKGLANGNAVLLHPEGCGYRVESIRTVIPLLAGVQLIEKCRQDTAALVFGGALVDNILLDIIKQFPEPPVIVVRDATRLFLSPEVYNRFISRGGRIAVLNRLNLIAVTLNPTDPCGRGYDPQMFLERMAGALSPCPVFDLVYEVN
jgi:hypothetical protein